MPISKIKEKAVRNHIDMNFFKECISRIERLEIRWKSESLTIYPDEILQEETILMEDGSRRIVDLFVKFKKADPAIYVEKWDGQLAIEIKDTHPVDNKKISQMKQKGLACLEFTVNNGRLETILMMQRMKKSKLLI